MEAARAFFHMGTIILSGIIALFGFSFKDQDTSLIVMGLGITLEIVSVAWMDIIYNLNGEK